MVISWWLHCQGDKVCHVLSIQAIYLPYFVNRTRYFTVSSQWEIVVCDMMFSVLSIW